MERLILHIDVNNAFLSWQACFERAHGMTLDLRNEVAVIGGDEHKRHGVVLAKSMKAKQYGIKTAETLYSARRKYPHLIVRLPRMDVYRKYSQKLFEYLKTYTPDIEILSIDECFLDYTPIANLYGDVYEFATKLAYEIKTKLGFTVNIGIANNKLCAKMASDFQKPDRVHTLYQHEIPTKMWILPIENLYMVGSKTALKLKSRGINTIGDLALYDYSKLNNMSFNQALFLHKQSNGIDDSIVDSKEAPNKGFSLSTTLSEDVDDLIEIRKIIFKLSEDIAQKLRRDNLYAYVIGLTFKDQGFVNYSGQRKLFNATNSTKEIYDECVQLLNKIWRHELIRNVGIRVSDFTDSQDIQLSLFDSNDQFRQSKKLDIVLDSLKSKYGSDIIKYGSEKF